MFTAIMRVAALHLILFTTSTAQHPHAFPLQHASSNEGKPRAIIAVALRGDIYAIPTLGGPPRRLTSYGLNSDPHLSPDGRRIAYLSTSRQYLSGGTASTHGVWIVPIDGPSDGAAAREVTRPNPAVDRGNLAWSPNGSGLAYREGTSLVVSTGAGTPSVVVLHLATSYHSGSPTGGVAWSPDGRHLAIISSEYFPHGLDILVADLSGTDSFAMIRFPPHAPGNAVVGQSLSWSADGRSFIFETTTIGEGGGLLTGLWQAPLQGGSAHLIVGQSSYKRSTAKARGTAAADALPPSLENATTFVASPDGLHLATDPVSFPAGDGPAFYHLWVMDLSDGSNRSIREGVVR